MPCLRHSLGKQFQHILLLRCAIDDVVVRNLRIEDGEAVMMLAGNGDVLHARSLGER